ncbi:MAG TPA: hypothetical protein EYG73_04565 [Arcobacter sp.]|nr:hypothetical protein [Arcobacter sp.]
MKKLSISIDMGAKNNGIFIAKIDNDKIVDKKAKCIVIDKNSIKFSKVSRRANRHKVRNIKRRKLAKRLLWEILGREHFTKEQQELIQGLLNNRGYTYLSTSSEFESLQEESVEFIKVYYEDLKDLKTKDDFLEFLSDDKFSDEKTLLEFLDKQIEKLEIEHKKKKSDFYKEFRADHSIIKSDLKILKEFFINIQKEINTGSKPRTKYFKEIKEEIEKYDFIKDKESFFNLIGNISNLQLRVLRKYFNDKFDDRFDDEKLYKKLNDYFRRFHDKDFETKVFEVFNTTKSLKEFLEKCSPMLTIPPHEDMNNRNSYKCNSMLIKDSVIAESLKKSVDRLLQNSAFKVLDEDGLTYAQKLQRILDINSKIIPSTIYPRNVFKHQKDNSDIKWYQDILQDGFNEFSQFAKRYYREEEKVLSGIYEDSFLFRRCNLNTPYKNNIKHILLRPIYSYEFTKDEADKFLKDIKSVRGLQTSLKRVSEEAKNYQNSFYHIIEACFNNEECIEDKNIKTIIKNIDKNLSDLKTILQGKDTYLATIDGVDSKNLKRVINIFKQTYEILFENISGFNKTCRHCTQENAVRSDEKCVIGKRLLSDVAKPIDGMLDMMLDRIAWEIVKDISKDDIEDIQNIEIVLEQNRFEFEESLIDIKRSSNNQIKQKKREYKDRLNVNVCPYTGKKFEKGDWDHILPRSKGVYNSKANLIYCSIEGNQNVKKNQDYTLEMIKEEHLKAIFGKDKNLEEIKEIIEKGLDSIDVEKFTNFDNLKLHQQIALRYALFMKGTKAYEKAFRIIKLDKIKTISNGTQKRLARKVHEKLVSKFSDEMKQIDVNSKVVDNKQVSATRNDLAVDQETGEVNHLFKTDIQDAHSHCIDAMVAFYLVNKDFDFDEIYVDNSAIDQVTKSKTFINSENIKSYKLFQDTVYSEHYKHFTKEEKIVDLLIKHNLLYINKDNNKVYIEDKNQIETVAKIDKIKLSNLLFEAFEQKNESLLKVLKPLDKKRYNTTRKDIINIFYSKEKLLPFEKIKDIPPYQEKTYKAVYKVLQKMETFDFNTYQEIMTKFFKLQKRKRNKKRHIFSLPSLGQNAKFRIKRGDQIAIVGSENIATKTFLVDGKLVQVPFFSKNVIPLKIADLLNAMKLNENAKAIYQVNINIDQIKEYVNKLVYTLTEASRLTVKVTLLKSAFDVDFDQIKQFNGAQDDEFRSFLQKYIQNKESILYSYLGSIRDTLNGKALLLDNSQHTITLQYKADINSYKKEIILNNI